MGYLATDRKKRGFTSIGTVIINKIQDDKKFDTPACFFNEKDNPK